MTYEPEVHHRRSIRLQGYDYSQPGMYYVTICTQGKEHWFGEVVEGEMIANEAGRMAEQQWKGLPQRFPNATLDEFVIMPNHIHAIIQIVGAIHELPRQSNAQGPVGAIHESPLPCPHRRPNRAIHESPHESNTPPRRRGMMLSKIVGYFKMNSAKRANQMSGKSGHPVWQRNYYEHIIRNEDELRNIREYIRTNPLRWASDPEFTGKTP
jgi:putative transposase